MPYQLSPTVIEPEISVSTIWPGATPYEIEREIIEEQERVLKGIPGLIEMESSSYNSSGSITLKFKIGVNINDALLRVSNKLNEVLSYPENTEKPVINATGASASPVIWMILKTTEENPNPIHIYRTYFEDEIRQYLERVDNVADLFVKGGAEKEMQIVVRPDRLASYGLTIKRLTDVLQRENANISAGTMAVGRRDFRIRTVGEFDSPENIANIVIDSTGQRRIFVRDVADVGIGYAKLTDAMMHNFKDGIAVGVKPEPDANILDLTDKVEEVVIGLNEGKLKDKGIYLDWAYDQRPYIGGAIALVRKNIMIGGLLAITVLLIFLKNISSTLIVSTAIPVSILGAFIFMNFFGRNLNVVSLAGISFAVGMLVDNAIVVLENIDRHRKTGKSPIEAAYSGASEVKGAIVASTLTTVAVFLPVIFMEEEAGQLFRDIAIAVTCAVSLSLFVSIFMIPMFSGQLYGIVEKIRSGRGEKKLFFPIIGTLHQAFGSLLLKVLMKIVKMATGNWFARILTILVLTLLSVATTIYLTPKMEYLPQGNRNLILNILIPPPGLSYNERKDTGEYIFESARPLIGKDYKNFPAIKDMFYVGSDAFMLFGAISEYEQRAGELIPFFRDIMFSIPAMFGVSEQAGIFQSNISGGRTIDVDLSGSDLNKIIAAAGAMFGTAQSNIPGSQIRPLPSLELQYPEVRFIPNRERIKAVGMDTLDVGLSIDVFMDGRKIGDFKKSGEKKIDLVLKGADNKAKSPEELYRTQIVTPSGKNIPLSALVHMERTTGITEIRHLERKRTITLQVTPPFSIPLEAAMDTINLKIIPEIKEQGLLDEIEVRMSGTADKLTETRESLQWNFILAAVITYLLMSALFGNFIYPFIIMFTVPLAAAGGFIGLKLVNTFINTQPLDILTMLGFVILIGVVVNNAILIVHQSLNNIRFNGMGHNEAVTESVRTRLRPIYMSAFTSIFGMLPLVIAPGPGSELYRGLGSVVLGGLALSTVFTIFVIPALLMFFIKMERKPSHVG